MEESDTKTNSVDLTEIKGVVSSIKELRENTEPINPSNISEQNTPNELSH